jgi:hypothetical protein
VCPPRNCKVPRCEVGSGCLYDDFVCPTDNNDCTTDTCNTENGNCEYPSRVCDDRIACTINDCNTIGGCDFSRTTCSPNCETCNHVTGTCDPLCNPNHDCATFDHCDTTSGECIFTNFNPSLCPADVCFVPVCTPSGCSQTPRVCTGPNPCFRYSCSPGDGTCVGTPDPIWQVECNDGIPCTSDVCRSVNGVAGCANIPNDSECGIGLPSCYDKQCVPGVGCNVEPNPGKCPNPTLSCLRTKCDVFGCGFDDLCLAQGNTCACSATLDQCVCSGPH